MGWLHFFLTFFLSLWFGSIAEREKDPSVKIICTMIAAVLTIIYVVCGYYLLKG